MYHPDIYAAAIVAPRLRRPRSRSPATAATDIPNRITNFVHVKKTEFVMVKITKTDVLDSARQIVTKGGRPYVAVEDDGFKLLAQKIIDAWNEKYPSKRFQINRRNIRDHIDAQAVKLEKLITEEVSEIFLVSFQATLMSYDFD